MIESEMFAQTNKRYIVPQLKSKFNRLRKKHREFSDLIEHTGFGWDPIANTVTASDDAWANYIKVLFTFTYYYLTFTNFTLIFYIIKLISLYFFLQRVPGIKPYRKKGLEHYRLLGEIFNTTTATGQLHYSSSQLPPNSDEERELEDNFLNTGVHIDIDEDVDGVDTPQQSTTGK